MTEQRIEWIRHDDGVVELHLNRPDKMNALDPAMIDGILAAIDRLAVEPGLRAVVLETFYSYWPIFDIADKTMTLDGQTSFTLGLGSGIVFREFVVTRPRGPHTVWNSSK